jgi:hypothetical protein
MAGRSVAPPVLSRHGLAGGFLAHKGIPMTPDAALDFPDRPRLSGPHGQEKDASQPVLRELIAALQPHPRGLRRWSVMRVIRSDRHRAARDIQLKFESDVEGVFRKFSADAMDARVRVCAAEDAPFCRPRNTAGEVWALRPGKAEAWLGADITAISRLNSGGA